MLDEKHTEVIETTEHSPAFNPTRTSAVHYDYIMNGYGLSPNYIQNIVSWQKVGAVGAGGYGAYRFQENNDVQPFKRLGPHSHPNTEYFIFYATDPEHPDTINGTTEFWLGAGEDAEPYLITKPTVVCVPPNVPHLPEIYRGFTGANAQTVVFESSLWAISNDHDVDALLSPKLRITPIEQPADLTQFTRKYQDCITEQDLRNAPFYPSHQGKSQPILQFDIQNNPHATKYIEANLISGADIGFGCGDMIQYQDYTIRSQPHIHDSVETYIFIPANPDLKDDLGATVEFWIGEGAQAKRLIINKPTVLLVPPNTVHLPLYVQELRSPFILLNMIDNPIWNVFYTNQYPPEFEHKIEPDLRDLGKFQLKYHPEKCIHCGLCGQQCQVEGIDIEATPPRIGEPCIRCGQCALLCPVDAIAVEIK